MWSLICFLYIITFILKQEKNILSWTVAILSALFIGGASESFALIFVFTFLIIITLRKKLARFVHPQAIPAIATLTLLMIISFIISVSAPGTDIRHDQLPHTGFAFKLWVILKSVLKYFALYLPTHAAYILLFCFPWLWFGSKYLNEKWSDLQRRAIIKNGSLLFLLSLFMVYCPTVYVMSSAGPDRALLIVSLLTVTYFTFLFLITGSYFTFKRSREITVFLVTGGLSIIVLCYHIGTQFAITREFANSYEHRMQTINEAMRNEQTGVLLLKPLPSSGMLYWEELSPDTGYFVNQHLKMGLNLPFAVKIN
jgi:hypothetical protein